MKLLRSLIYLLTIGFFYSNSVLAQSCGSDASYLSCLSACDASDSNCSALGTHDHYLAFLRSAIPSCTYPNIDSAREYNGLKQVLQGLKQIGALSGAEAKTLRKAVDSCRRALHQGEHDDHGNHQSGHDHHSEHSNSSSRTSSSS